MNRKRIVSVGIFVMYAVVCTSLEILGELIDHELELEFVFEPFFLVATIIICWLTIKKMNHRHIVNMGMAKRVMVLSAVPIGLSALILVLCTHGQKGVGEIALIVISVFLSAVVEELYFRGIGIHLLHDDDGKICLKDTCWLVGVFGVMHFLPTVLVPDLWLEELAYSAVAMALAYFLLGAYMAADSSVLPTVVHMMVLLPQRLTHTIDHDSFFVKYGVLTIYVIMTVFCIAAGTHLLHNSKGYRKSEEIKQ